MENRRIAELIVDTTSSVILIAGGLIMASAVEMPTNWATLPERLPIPGLEEDEGQPLPKMNNPPRGGLR